MAHWSEHARQLELKTWHLKNLSDAQNVFTSSEPAVYLFRLPFCNVRNDDAFSQEFCQELAQACAQTHSKSVICILTSPSHAARLIPHLESIVQFQLWVAVKTPTNHPQKCSSLPTQHATLLILTRYRGSLRHTKTRIRYSYCPACGKTTKDYGGKKHVYHEYGTLMSDVWRDFEILDNWQGDVVNRLSDLFGLAPYEVLHSIELSQIAKTHIGEEKKSYTTLNLDWNINSSPMSRLINADCLDALQELPSNSIDFCFADPPYNLQKKYDHWNDGMELRAYFEWCDLWLRELARVLKPGGTLSVLNIPLWSARHYQFLASILNYQYWIVWDALSFPVRQIMPAHYSLLCFSKGSPRELPGIIGSSQTKQDIESLLPLEEGFCLRANCIAHRQKRGINDRGMLTDLWHDIHRLKHNSRRVDHPCQLPPGLMKRLFALFTYPGETVLDCFNGAGTSTLVAQQMGRNYIGIEISTQYHELAMQRHEWLDRGMDPFTKQIYVPSAKNSPVKRLPKQKYAISKKSLQLEVKRIAKQLGRLPSREEVGNLSQYSLEYYDKYFISWGEVCAAARTTGMSENPTDPQMDQLSLAID